MTTSMTTTLATRFAEEWIDAWNAHDLERILLHWTDDCVFRSPLIVTRMGDASGTVRGKDALRAYWGRALAASPDLRFELDAVFVGHTSIVIGYRNHRGQSCAEWIELDDDGHAKAGAAHYSAA